LVHALTDKTTSLNLAREPAFSSNGRVRVQYSPTPLAQLGLIHLCLLHIAASPYPLCFNYTQTQILSEDVKMRVIESEHQYQNPRAAPIFGAKPCSKRIGFRDVLSLAVLYSLDQDTSVHITDDEDWTSILP
jgi:hypothetical protein